MKYKRGDIYYVELPLGNGSVQTGIRPCLNVQNNKGNEKSPTSMVMVITTKIHKNYLPTHTLIKKSSMNGLKHDSCVVAEQIFTVSKEHQILEKVGVLEKGYMGEVNNALKISLGL